MAIFSRRKLQHLLNENASFMSEKQLARHVRHLNRDDAKQVINTEWEVVMLYAFSRLGRVLHEPDIGGGKFADIQFYPTSYPETPLLLEITTVSDKGLEAENNVEAFERELQQRIFKYIKSGSFFHKVKFRKDFNCNSSNKAIARLPERKNFNTEIFNRKFESFLDAIRNAPSKVHTYDIDTDTTGVFIRYEPGRNSWVSLGVPYRKATSTKNNVIWNALNSKRQQLKKINYSGLQGIILCDAGCEMLYSKIGNLPRYSASTIIQKFLEKHGSVHFVTTIATVQFDRWRHHNLKSQPRYIVEMETYFNQSFPNDPLIVKRIFEEAYKHLPIPDSSCEEVRLNLENGGSYKIGSSHRGGFTVGEGGIQISLRDLFEYLAGELPQHLKYSYHSYGADFFRRQFNYYFEKGFSIEHIAVEQSDEDDNWVSIKFFNNSDAALQLNKGLPPLASARGVLIVRDNEIQIPLHELFAYLSGTLPEEVQIKSQPSYGAGLFRKIFYSFWKKSLAIEQIRVTGSDGGSGWATFRFSSVPDPAVSPFVIPCMNEEGRMKPLI